MVNENAPEGRKMDAETRLAAYAVVEEVLYQIKDPDRVQEHRDKLEAIMRGKDPVMVAVSIAVVLIGAAVETGYPLGTRIEQLRAQALAEE